MSVTVSVAHGLPFVPTLVAMATAAAFTGVLRTLRGLTGELQALTGDLAVAQATPMTVRIAMHATGASAQAIALRSAAPLDPAPLTPDRCPVLGLAPGGRAAA